MLSAAEATQKVREYMDSRQPDFPELGWHILDELFGQFGKGESVLSAYTRSYWARLVSLPEMEIVPLIVPASVGLGHCPYAIRQRLSSYPKDFWESRFGLILAIEWCVRQEIPASLENLASCLGIKSQTIVLNAKKINECLAEPVIRIEDDKTVSHTIKSDEPIWLWSAMGKSNRLTTLAAEYLTYEAQVKAEDRERLIGLERLIAEHETALAVARKDRDRLIKQMRLVF